MTFAGTARVHKSLPAWRRVARAGVAVAAASVLLAACGGGDQVKKFRPSKIVSFGDEASALVSETVNLSGGGTATVHGLKYGVNALNVYRNGSASLLDMDQKESSASGTTKSILAASSQPAWANFPTNTRNVTAVETLYGSDVVVIKYDNLDTLVTDGTTTTTEQLDINYRYNYSCVDNMLWMQVVARRYGLGYQAQCPADTGRSGAYTYAQNGAKVAETAAQVAAHRSELDSGTLVTLMAGQNDVLEVYGQLKAGTLTLSAAEAELKTRGGSLAAVANDIIKTGARVLLIRLGNLGRSPLAISEGRVNDLSELTKAFNDGLLSKVTNDGHKIAMWNFYDQTEYMYDIISKGNNRSYDNINNISTPLCSSTGYKPDATSVATTGNGLLYCSNNTLNSGVSTSTYFWADQTRMGPAGHSALGNRAYDQADNNTL